jgi:sugar fermentation stimulation protein A
MGRGSSSLPSRIKRHLRKTKRLRWHIDFLLNANVLVHGFVYAESATSVECEISKSLSKSSKVLVKGFGASDCKAGCASHLHHFPDANSQTVLKMLILTYKRLNFEPHYLKKVSASVL